MCDHMNKIKQNTIRVDFCKIQENATHNENQLANRSKKEHIQNPCK